MREPLRITCPCCGYKTITTEHDICGICGWQHDLVQEADPSEHAAGANRVTLREAQRNFATFGAKSKEALPHAGKPGPETERDPGWRPLSKPD